MSARDIDRARDGDRVRVPADIDRPDKLLGGLTARQLAILAVAAVALWAGYAATRRLIPPAAFAAGAIPLMAVAVVLAVGRIDGKPTDRYLFSALAHWRSPRRLVPAPEPIADPPALLADKTGPPPVALRLPIAGVDGDGTVDLGTDGRAVICRARAVGFSLRTPAEQEAMVAGFARFLNSLSEPVQIVVRSQPVDLAPAISALEEASPALPHPALEAAARDHARFLADLANRGLLSREVLVVLRQPDVGDDASGRLARRAVDAAAALASAGVSLAVLDGPAAAAVLATAADPASPRPVAAADNDTPVTAAADVEGDLR